MQNTVYIVYRVYKVYIVYRVEIRAVARHEYWRAKVPALSCAAAAGGTFVSRRDPFGTFVEIFGGGYA